MTDPKRIRNYAIFAHIDHGKSTLADQANVKFNPSVFMPPHRAVE